MTPASRRLAAIMFTDVVGFTALMAESEERGLRVREGHRTLVGPLVRRYGGESLEIRGDECLSVFPSALDAVNCALAIQAGAAGEPDLALHVGIHLGDVLIADGEASGDGVNIASRLSSLSEGGGVLVSAEVHHAVRNQPGIEATPLGEHDFRNVGRPVDVHRLTGSPSASRATARVPTPRRRTRLSLAGITVLAALGVWFWQALPASSGEIRAIAVLPLENLSGDPGQDYVADAMTTSLIFDLAKLGTLRVISRTSVMRYRDAKIPLPQIAKELGVDAVVEGSVQIAGNRVRIHAQLIDARSDHHVWAEQYDRDARDVLALQREIAHAIAREIELTISPLAEASLAAGKRPIDPAAHDAYLKGLHFQRRHTLEGSDKAILYFDEAISIEPEFALAFAAKADTWSCSPMHPWTIPVSARWPAAPSEVMARADEAVRVALALEPDLAEAYASQGLVRMFGSWDWDGAEESFRRAIELNPSYWFAHHVYGYSLALRGRTEEGLTHTQTSLELNPFEDIVLLDRAELLEWQRKPEEARRRFEETIELHPNFAQAHQGLGRVLCSTGRVAQALVAFERARTLAPDDEFVAGDMGHCYAVSGRPGEAHR
ncbi:MAG: tetratricopeptide repeat protein, partial [Myxococcota bacterium]